MKETEADASNLADFLGRMSSRFCVPFFQRNYSWGKEQLERFWEDVFKVISTPDKERNFLGAFVLQLKSAKVVGTQEYTVIDGQQRLTTIFLTLIACSEYADEMGWVDWRYSDIQRQFFECQAQDHRGELRLEPYPLDRRQFNEIFKRFGEHRIQPFKHVSGDSSGLISETYEECRQHLKEALATIGDLEKQKTLSEFLERFLGNTEIVYIALDAKRNAHEVFDRLNNAGARLRIIDLIRNEVHQHVTEKQAVLYHEKWEPFEKELADAFADLTTPKQKSKAIDDFFWPYALIQNSAAVKSRMFSDLQKYWQGLPDDGTIGYGAASLIIEDLTEWLPAYFALKRGRRPDNMDDAFWKRLETLNDMPIHVVTYSYLMQLIRNHVRDNGKHPAKACIECVDLIESFFVRRAVAGHEPSGLHAIFKVLWDKAKSDPPTLRKHLQTRTIKIPDDKQFKENIVNVGLYGRSLAGFILRRYEESLWEGKHEAFRKLPDSSIDHVMPEKARSGDWKPIITMEEHATYKDTWGNLVLLSKGLNSLKGNKSFDDAKVILEEHTIFKSAQEILEYESWDAEQIKKRSGKLADWAIKRWPV